MVASPDRGRPAAAAASSGKRPRSRACHRVDRAVPEDPPLILRRQRRAGAHRGRSGRQPEWPCPSSARHRRPRRTSSRARRPTWPRWGSARRSMPRSRKPPRTGPAGHLLLADAPGNGSAQMDLTAKGSGSRHPGQLRHRGQGGPHPGGPVVTQYALDVEPGIKLSRIQGLADNLALALSARSIRSRRRSRRAVRRHRDPERGLRPRHPEGGARLEGAPGARQRGRAGLRPWPGRGRSAGGCRPRSDAAPAHRRRDRIGQERA